MFGLQIITCFSIGPVSALLAMGFMFFYPLNKVKIAQVQSDLIERRRPSANRP